MICQIKDIGSSAVEIGQITAVNYETIQNDGSSDEIIEGIILHGNGIGKKSKTVMEASAGHEYVSSEINYLMSQKRQHIETPFSRRLEVSDD